MASSIWFIILEGKGRLNRLPAHKDKIGRIRKAEPEQQGVIR
jgi:hypothetical protein